MDTHTHEHTVFTFDELSEKAQDKAIEDNYNWNVDDNFWHECVIDDCKELGKLFGIDIDNIYFSGFWSQGDGACFEGDYSYAKQGLKKVQEYAPQDNDLHSIVKALQDLQKVNFYRLSAHVKHKGHYHHEMCTIIDVDYMDYNDDCPAEYWNYRDNKPDEALSELLRDFMRWIYKRLEADYDYLTSKEAIKESFESNETQFNEDGTIHW